MMKRMHGGYLSNITTKGSVSLTLNARNTITNIGTSAIPDPSFIYSPHVYRLFLPILYTVRSIVIARAASNPATFSKGVTARVSFETALRVWAGVAVGVAVGVSGIISDCNGECCTPPNLTSRNPLTVT